VSAGAGVAGRGAGGSGQQLAGPLRAITWEHERGCGSLRAAAERHRELTGVEVVVDARSLQAFADAPLDRTTAGYDLVVLDHPHIPLAADAGLLMALDGVGHDDELADLARHTVGASHASYAHDGHQWALAHDAAAQVAAYRPDLLAAPPRTWTEVLELARAGRVLWPAKPIDAFSSLCTLAAHQGARPPVGPGTYLPAAVVEQCLALLHELTAAVPAECLTLNPIEVAERLSTGDHVAYAPLLFGYTNYARAGYRPHRLRYVDIPVLTPGAAPAGSLLGGAGIAVVAATRRPEEAVDFAFWVAGAEAQTGVYFDGGGQPGHALAWEDDRLNRETGDFFRGTRATLEGAWTRPRAVGFVDFQDTIAPLVTDCLAGRLDDASLVEALDAASARHLDRTDELDRQEAAGAHG
jgi:multiple sugar transport system substrate-binding protein